MRTLLLILILTTVATTASADYTTALKADVVKLMGASDPKIPDDVEAAYWECWAGSFVKSVVGISELRTLDTAIDTHDTSNALLVKFQAKVEDGLTKPNGKVAGWVSDRMHKDCPETISKLLSY